MLLASCRVCVVVSLLGCWEAQVKLGNRMEGADVNELMLNDASGSWARRCCCDQNKGKPGACAVSRCPDKQVITFIRYLQ